MRLVKSWRGISLCIFVWFCTAVICSVTKFVVIGRIFVGDDEDQDFDANYPTDKRLSFAGRLLGRLFDAAAILGLISHLATMLTDPGSTKIAPANPPSHFNGIHTYCTKCQHRWKPPRAHHCRVCNECIFKMDHHCPWVNNCVGHLNQKYFVLFLVYMGLACFLNLVIVLWGCFKFFASEDEFKNAYFGQWDYSIPVWFVLILVGLCSVVTVAFLILNLDYLSEQWTAIATNTTLLETYRYTRGKQTTLWKQISDTFGRKWWLWWLPVPPMVEPDWCDMEYEDSPEKSG